MIPPPEPAAQLTPDEAAYHRAVYAAQRESQAIVGHWVQYLARKYALGPRDAIEEDGTIVRVMAREGE